MKKSIIYSLFSIVLLFACRKSDNPKIPDLTRVPTPLITKDTSGDLVISAQDPDKFKGKINVDLYFKNDVKPSKLDLVVIKNGDKTNVKTVQENITTYPTIVTVTGSQLATLFGSPVTLGDKFDFGADITTQNGEKFLAYPPVGEGYGANVPNQAGASISVRYEAVCKFDASKYAGDFEVLVDEWNDYPVGGTVAVTVLNDHQLSFKYMAHDAKPIIVDVNTVTNAVSVKKQVYGNYADQYGDYSVESVSGNDSYVAPCEGVLSILLNHTVAAGSFGNFLIKLKKK